MEMRILEGIDFVDLYKRKHEMEVLKSTLRKQCCADSTVVQITVHSNSEMAIFIDELSRNSLLSSNIAKTSFIDK
ncbi:hypothetical protein T07_4359 [Trichinella nelsoni]|uniref:Uncharacterized protein n=1 Tax=Trichinella nelsoni TaxID=6336 RepID=A0A0V0RXG0_9BILA|nr:hypothetical protein T07_4359 [Trichinella nelsoni]